MSSDVRNMKYKNKIIASETANYLWFVVMIFSGIIAAISNKRVGSNIFFYISLGATAIFLFGLVVSIKSRRQRVDDRIEEYE